MQDRRRVRLTHIRNRCRHFERAFGIVEDRLAARVELQFRRIHDVKDRHLVAGRACDAQRLLHLDLVDQQVREQDHDAGPPNQLRGLLNSFRHPGVGARTGFFERPHDAAPLHGSRSRGKDRAQAIVVPDQPNCITLPDQE
jgi:hypothetical protein